MGLRKRILADLDRRYGDAFGFIGRVMESCETAGQLEVATRWALGFIDRSREFEMGRHALSGADAVHGFFLGKRDIIIFTDKGLAKKYPGLALDFQGGKR